MKSATEFERRINAFYAEANRHGDHQALLRSGSVVAVVRDCRPALESRWVELLETLRGDGDLHLRMAVIAMRNMIATNRAILIEPDILNPHGVAYSVSVGHGVDLLA